MASHATFAPPQQPQQQVSAHAESTLPNLDGRRRESVMTANAAAGANKRKREGSDQHGPAGTTGAADGGAVGGRRAGSKRVAANPAVVLSSNDLAGQGADLGDASTNALVSTNSNRAPTGDDEMHHHSSAASLDLGALAQSSPQHAAHHNSDHPGHRGVTADMSDATSTAVAALAGIYPTMTVPQPTDLSFASTGPGGDNDRHLDPSFAMGEHEVGSLPFALEDFDADSSLQHMQVATPGGRDSTGNQKPGVGTEEWHRVRRDNHKEVERRRRETINEGINELAKIVPGCEKNKGSILQRAVAFITQLKENEAQNIEKWTLEKLLTEQAIAELSSSVDKLKQECERAWHDSDMWRKTCEQAGIAPRKDDGNATGSGRSQDSDS